MTSSFTPLPRIAALSAAMVILAAVDLTAQPRQIPPFDGVWKLNAEASVNPNGPALPARGPLPETSSLNPVFDDNRGEGIIQPNMSGGAIRLALSSDELIRFDAMTTLFFTAPPRIGVSTTATEFTLVLDPTNRLGYTHKTDNKAQPLVTSAGPAEFRVRWDGHKIRRELQTKDSLKITEEYTLSPDGRQLSVVVKASSSIVNMTTGEIRRVYDRVVVP